MEDMTKREKSEYKNQLIRLRNDINDALAALAAAQKIDMTDASKQNLCAFLVLQNLTQPALNDQLIEQGFSSLQTITPHILHSINKMIDHFSTNGLSEQPENFIDVQGARFLKNMRNFELLGKNEHDPPAIMVTLDQSILTNPEIFKDLLRSGMTIARINCAHDYYEVWKKLIAGVRNAEEEIQGEKPNTRCKIYMDLPGSKIRVGNLDKMVITKPSGELQEKQMTIKVKKDDILRISKRARYPGKPKTKTEPATIGITLPVALNNVRPGDKVFIDDGKICGKVVHVTSEFIDVKIILARQKKEQIKPGSGINFPDSLVYLNVPTISEKEIQILSLIAPMVDLIGISYIHYPNDIRKLKGHLAKLTDRKIGIIAKIETKAAMLALTKIILEGLNYDLFGVMIARGDLALEIGYQQLAKAQEGILEICRAAHIPVIWATDVLNRMNKKGTPLRTELTDAYMGLRADCIMINKGPYVPKSVKFIQQLDELNKDPLLEIRNSVVPFVQYGF
jgi:pyruvate kinase